MSLRGAAYIAGAWEHPTRKAPDKSAKAACPVRGRNVRPIPAGPRCRPHASAHHPLRPRLGSASHGMCANSLKTIL